ncbi:hypothetical protein CHU_1278 [Sporocytophaga myxococcoides]|uniref:Lipoprotein n=1 Tax=Sporocytophaga myxococcoides TaxID=153721 RepID=A0A098LLJ3_9BACT|nr:hypothetical protein [Sporocytophaga myxococcoides]GAL87013.1 hypothetical protein CHU_1278 [Sporocytophaga myxococcoides]
MKKLKRNSILWFAVFCACFLGISCKRDKHPEKMIGPEYKNADPGFFVVNDAFTATPSSKIDFTKGVVSFDSKFSQEVTYFLTLTGTSGASVSFTGKGSDLSKVKWDGGHNGLYFFTANDQVTAELSFLGSNIVLKSNPLTIAKPKSYGVLVGEDFEPFKAGHKKWPSGWYTFTGEAESGKNGAYNGIFQYPTSSIIVDPTDPNSEVINSVKPPSGSKYYFISGTDANNDFYIDGAGGEIALNLATNNPDSVYYNVFVYGRGFVSDKGSLKIQEDDNGSGKVEDHEDELFYDFKITWTGWKLISVKYSDLSFTKDAKFKGNKIREPKKAGKVGFTLLSDPSGATTRYGFDYPVFTYGKPLPQN